jgi:hypothetical protein
MDADYTDAFGAHVTRSIRFNSSTTDAYSHGANLLESDVVDIVGLAINRGLELNTDGVYFVVTSADVDIAQYRLPDGTPIGAGQCRTYCAWHNYAGLLNASGTLKYGLLPDPTRCPDNCVVLNTTLSPNGQIGFDAMATYFVHELEETATDPEFTGWYAPAAQGGPNPEIGDLCGPIFPGPGTPGGSGSYPGKSGGTADLRLGDRDYYVQTGYQLSSQSCVIGEPLPVLPPRPANCSVRVDCSATAHIACDAIAENVELRLIPQVGPILTQQVQGPSSAPLAFSDAGPQLYPPNTTLGSDAWWYEVCSVDANGRSCSAILFAEPPTSCSGAGSGGGGGGGAYVGRGTLSCPPGRICVRTQM